MSRRCGHCDKPLGHKAFKEHKRLYFHDGKWVKLESVVTEDGGESPPMSPLILSDPSSVEEPEAIFGVDPESPDYSSMEDNSDDELSVNRGTCTRSF